MSVDPRIWVLLPRRVREQYSGNQGIAVISARGGEQARRRIGRRETRLKKDAMKRFVALAAEQSIQEARASAVGPTEPAGYDRLTDDMVSSAMEAMESQTPEQVEKAAWSIARLARAMDASQGQRGANVFEYQVDDILDYHENNVFDYIDDVLSRPSGMDGRAPTERSESQERASAAASESGALPLSRASGRRAPRCPRERRGSPGGLWQRLFAVWQGKGQGKGQCVVLVELPRALRLPRAFVGARRKDWQAVRVRPQTCCHAQGIEA